MNVSHLSDDYESGFQGFGSEGGEIAFEPKFKSVQSQLSDPREHLPYLGNYSAVGLCGSGLQHLWEI